MSTVAKVFVVLNLILAVAFLGAASAFLGWDDWHKKKGEADVKAKNDEIAKRDGQLKELKQNYDDAIRARDDATKQRDLFQGENAAVKAAYAQMKTSYDELSSAAVAATRALLIAQNTIKEGRTLTDTLMTERQKLTDESKRFQEERDAAVTAQAKAERDVDKSITEMADLRAKLTDTETNLQRTEFRLTAILATHPGIEAGGAAQPMQTAKVLAADDSTNVVVISLGSEDGVKEGYRYTVSRGSAYVGQIEITHVEAKQAAGRSLRDVQKSSIAKGDDAMTSH